MIDGLWDEVNLEVVLYMFLPPVILIEIGLVLIFLFPPNYAPDPAVIEMFRSGNVTLI